MKMQRRRFLAGLAIAGSLPMLSTSALAAENLVVYNAVGTSLMQAFVEMFEAANPGISVQVVSGGSGELLTRVKAERNNPLGDILLGPDADTFDSDLALFDSYAPPEIDAFAAASRQPDDKYAGFSTNFQVFIVNTNMMPLAEAPQTWKDLADPKYKGKILMANPALSGSAFSQLHQVLALYGWDVMDQIVDNATFVSSSKLAFQNIAQGEIAVGLTSEFNVLKSRNEGAPVEAVYPSDGTALVNDAVGIIARGPNPEAARKFMDFITSKEAHEVIVSLDGRRSARQDVAPPEGLPDAASFATVPYDSVSAAIDKDAELARFDEVFSRK